MSATLSPPAGPAVVKLGGSLLEDPQLRGRTLRFVAERWIAGERLVLVHGGGKRIDRALEAAGLPRRFHAGLRITDAPTLEVVVSVLAGLVNKTLVAELTALGVPAAGISGADGFTLLAVPQPPAEGIDFGFVGRIVSSNPALIRALLAENLIPVVASIAVGLAKVGGSAQTGSDPSGGRPGCGLYNINADSAASQLAASLGASRLVFLTDVEGLKNEHGGTIESLRQLEAAAMLEAPFVTGGMLPKLAAALAALEAGVDCVRIAGPTTHRAALSNQEGGTRLVRS